MTKRRSPYAILGFLIGLLMFAVIVNWNKKQVVKKDEYRMSKEFKSMINTRTLEIIPFTDDRINKMSCYAND